MKLIYVVIYIIGMIIAAMMSWKCSGLQGRKINTRVWWAFVSSLMSWSYVINRYWIMNWDTCDVTGIKRLCDKALIK